VDARAQLADHLVDTPEAVGQRGLVGGPADLGRETVAPSEQPRGPQQPAGRLLLSALLGELPPLAPDLVASDHREAGLPDALLEELRVRVAGDGCERRPQAPRLLRLEPWSGEHLEHQSVPALLQHPPALLQAGEQVGDVDEHVPGPHQVEGRIGERKGLDPRPGHVHERGHRRLRLSFAFHRLARPVDLRLHRIDPEGRTPEPAGQPRQVAAAATADVQGSLPRPQPDLRGEVEEHLRAARIQALVEERPNRFLRGPLVGVEVLDRRHPHLVYYSWPRPTRAPSMTDDLACLDATAQADLIRRREATPLELVEAAILRIEKLNPELNAVIHPSFERARSQASSVDLPDGPFRGVPFLIKDILFTAACEP